MNWARLLYRGGTSILFSLVVGVTYGLMVEMSMSVVLLGSLVITGFFSFLGGVIAYDEEVVSEKLLAILSYVVIGAFSVAHTSIDIPAYSYLAPTSMAIIWLGYTAQKNYANGEQPYQKYEWVPANPFYLFLTPYYYYKYKTSPSASE